MSNGRQEAKGNLQMSGMAASPVEGRVMDDIVKAAQSMFDNRLGWSEGRPPYAPRDFWADLGAALYGEDDPRVQELREETKA